MAGHEVALGDIVRVNSDVSSGCAGGAIFGDGSRWTRHHQASASSPKEAFRAAADPKRFPEQIAKDCNRGRRKSFTRECVRVLCFDVRCRELHHAAEYWCE